MRTLLGISIVTILLASSGGPYAAAQQAATPQPTSLATATSVAQVIPIQDFVRDDGFDDIKLSPSGKYVARSINIAEKTVLIVQNRADGKITGHFNLVGKTQVQDFWWANDDRLLISVGEKFGLLEKPQGTGEIYAMNADGNNQGILIGFRVNENNIGSHITTGKATAADAAYVEATLPNDPRHAIVSVWPKATGSLPFTKAALMDVNTGQINVLATAPVRGATFVVDHQGGVRFARGAGNDNRAKTYYRDDAKSEWTLLNDEAVSGLDLFPLGFSADGRIAYLEKEEAKGPDGIYAFDTATRKMQLQLRDPVADPSEILLGPNGEVVGVEYGDGKPRTAFFDENNPLAKLHRSLEASFPDQAVVITGYTSDGKDALVYTYSDRSPGDYYVFDIENKKAVHLISHRDWIDPDRMGEQRPVTMNARDGVVLHGFLTLPQGSNGKNLPLVVNPHGGPIGISDEWGFDGETQLIASRGYAVLQVNYRGSGGFGREFSHMGYKQWGGKMQDDVTDATRWAIQQGIADPHRICIYGASYGAYAALMGVVKEPSLYRCAVGYVGVYDMPAMYTSGDNSESKSGLNGLNDILGKDNLESISPNHLADRITVPVMLAAGKEDERAPPSQTEMMRDALEKAGKHVDATIYTGEGHGFFVEADRESFYNHLLNFLNQNIGSGVAGSEH